MNLTNAWKGVIGATCIWNAVASAAPAVATAPQARFEREALPLLKEYCFDCHGEGMKKGGVSFDPQEGDHSVAHDPGLWLKALKNLRAGIMPPPGKPQPTAEQKLGLEHWIKDDVFDVNPENLDPGRVTVRRLNRVEYRNTIRDLLGVDFDTEKEFPPDDAGHGFDNIADVLTLPPMLLEKYLAAARTVVTRAVPAVAAVPAEQVLSGGSFRGAAGSSDRTNRVGTAPGSLTLSYYDRASVSNQHTVKHGGKHQVLLSFTANERFVDNQFDYNKCRVVFKIDGKEMHSAVYSREGGRVFRLEFDQEWAAGAHTLEFLVEPLTPDQKQVRSLSLRLDSVTIRGPLDPRYYVPPKNYSKFFPKPTPVGVSSRRRYARELLSDFVERAYRRPADAKTVNRLVTLAEATSSQSGKTFEQGIMQAMVAVLASPRFLFREEGVEPVKAHRSASASSGQHPLVDEYALASRLSYFLWSSMPDAELLRLARDRKLRANLAAQTQRMLTDRKSDALVRNFVGQWLQVRDVESVQIDARQVLSREAPADPDQERRRQRSRELRDKPESSLTAQERKELEELRASFGRRFGRGPRAELTGDLRRAMRQETEKAFDYVLRNDRSLVELLNSDYTFLNERLARHYGLTNLNVVGEELVRVTLPPGSERGGVITHGSVLAVTSNPTRTSPVKRGLFILDNLLGTPPPPPPPDIPPLEDALRTMREKPLTLRQTLALHREQPLCSSCHNRMDPLGLALENFNAMGMWREQERSQPIDASGKLLSGESFIDVRELKKILATKHVDAFFDTVTEKLLTYALGRGLEYYDVATVDAIVERLKATGGKPSTLIAELIQSAPFQRVRASTPVRLGAAAPGSDAASNPGPKPTTAPGQ